ncbi:helix-turn-helix domain-containing protein [Rubrobacter tropicus]|uniref:Helix-turn-helix domain-containing protein n=1 Tax=Rubrobacter tropicus TaxID=2653851 RepID=A0A6G8QC77_9ACTN|nr:helix-turn-helix transcriptional regulator [Rubrobacter tropicus]QIN84086.1 helix-turn-helix domain-containing protein [Rubrobacter tropicus]
MNDEHGSPRPEPGIGRGLQEAREEKGLTLQQVEQRTKIRARYLQAFERENFDVLPAVYVLGSLKTYADFLGLDGAALSGRLKGSLVQPAGPDLPAQLAALEGLGDEDDEYEAVPATAVGFDQLFLGMGVLLISILAVMTIVTALARGDDSPISQLDEPSTPETPSEIALAANVEDGAGPQPPRANDAPAAKDDGDVGNKGGERVGKENREDEPEASKDGEDGKGREASRATSLFGDAKFVPMSPSPPTAPSSASATAPSSASATAKPDGPSASHAPVNHGASSPAPLEDDPDTASAPPATAPGSVANAPSLPGDRGARAPAPAPAGGDERGRISVTIDRKIDQAFEDAGLGR